MYPTTKMLLRRPLFPFVCRLFPVPSGAGTLPLFEFMVAEWPVIRQGRPAEDERPATTSMVLLQRQRRPRCSVHCFS